MPKRHGFSGLAVLILGIFAGPVSAKDQPPAQPAVQPPADSQQAPAQAPATPTAPSGSGLPVPRYVSLKSDRVNLRNGPGTDYPTGWVYRRAGLPIEVIKEFEGWRQVRDSEGVTGWVLQSFLSGRRTALVLPWENKAGAAPPQVPIRSGDSENSAMVAKVEAGVIANLHNCDGRWCRVTIDSFAGFIEQKKLWGVYEGETLK
jgi:SH3-like domain-containing protein